MNQDPPIGDTGWETADAQGRPASLYARWRRPLVRMLGRYFDSPAAAEDASQEIFTRMAAADTVLPPDEERPYLRRAARSMAGEAWRKHPGRHGVELVQAGTDDDATAQMPADAASDTAAGAAQRQRLARLHAALAELPPRQREAFVLHRVEGRTVEETAERMGISVRMAVKHLSRALSYCQMRVQYADVA